MNLEDKPTSDSGDNTSTLDSPAQRTAEFDVVRLSGVSAAWDRKAKPALNDIDLTLESGKLYMCIGPVASVSVFNATVKVNLFHNFHV